MKEVLEVFSKTSLQDAKVKCHINTSYLGERALSMRREKRHKTARRNTHVSLSMVDAYGVSPSCDEA